MKINRFLLLAAGLSLAITFALSCSGGDDNDGGGTSSSSGGGDDYPVASNCSLNGEPVTIGTQTWMAENLNCNVSGSKCPPEGTYGDLSDANTAVCDTYGRYYTWATAMALPSNCNSTSCASLINAKHRGICPEGWHIPSDVEWTTLTDFAGGSSTAGTKLKATTNWECGNGTNDYGFSALPSGSGVYTLGGNVLLTGGSNGYHGYWWSASEGNASNAWYRYIHCSYEKVERINYDKTHFYSVRCVKD
jgi:uncharacterized protein (TIGR02145 family)